ncbi:MAG: tetratricopeptide repeat protein [Alphaproteobacteria bacterium]|nr:tetratricopeptide repeat protein [Alphaproteobacteria bacterium]
MLRWALCISVAAAACVQGAAAEPVTSSRAWTNCEGKAGVWTDLRVSGCTAVLSSGEAKGADLAKAHYYRGNALLAKREYLKAIDDYDAALAIAPDDANALHERCWSRAVLAIQLEDALSDCNEALRIRPNDGETLGGRGFVYLRLGFYRTAILDYDAALDRKPDTAEFLYARGTAKIRAGEVEGGNADMAAARALEPDIAQTFATYDEAGGTTFWGAIAAYWGAAMKWIY